MAFIEYLRGDNNSVGWRRGLMLGNTETLIRARNTTILGQHSSGKHHRCLVVGTSTSIENESEDLAHVSLTACPQKIRHGKQLVCPCSPHCFFENKRNIHSPARVEREVVHDGSGHKLGDSSLFCHLSTSRARLLVEMLRRIRMHVEHHHVDLIGAKHRRDDG